MLLYQPVAESSLRGHLLSVLPQCIGNDKGRGRAMVSRGAIARPFKFALKWGCGTPNPLCCKCGPWGICDDATWHHRGGGAPRTPFTPTPLLKLRAFDQGPARTGWRVAVTTLLAGRVVDCFWNLYCSKVSMPNVPPLSLDNSIVALTNRGTIEIMNVGEGGVAGKVTKVPRCRCRIVFGYLKIPVHSCGSVWNNYFQGVEFGRFVDYPKMLNQLVPVHESKRWNPDKLNSRCISLCMNQWIDAAHIGPDSSRLAYREIGSARNMDHSKDRVEILNKEVREQTSDDGLAGHHANNAVSFCDESQTANGCRNRESDSENTRLSPRKQVASSPRQLSPRKKVYSDHSSAPLPSGDAFWPEGKTLQVQQNPKFCLSLVQDSREHLQNDDRPLSEREKRWTKRVGGMLFTGEGHQVCSESHMHGLDWAKPSTSHFVSVQNPKNSKPQNLLSLNLKQQLGRNISPCSTKTTPRDYMQNKVPPTGGTGKQHILRPKTASPSLRATVWPSISRVTTPKDGMFTSRSESAIQGNKNRNPQKLVSQVNEDVAAVRALT
eukprot:Gb_03456 [translate_table: standard]